MWSWDGVYCPGEQSDHDLIEPLATHRPEAWINVSDDQLINFKTRENADHFESTATLANKPPRLACRHILWDGTKIVDVTEATHAE